MLFQLNLPGGISITDPNDFAFSNATLADVINALLKYVFPISGLVLFFMLIAGGFQLLTSAGNPEKTSGGYKKIIFAIIGFLIIFMSYWLIEIIERVFGIEVL